jgi:hypothetical protein
MNIATLILSLLGRIRMGIGMLLPIFRDAADFRTWNRWVRWGVHLLLLGLVLWGLHWVQHQPWMPIDENLVARVPSKTLGEYWLCAVFLVFYITCWVGYALYQLYWGEVQVAEFPDLDRAWRAAVAGLAKAGIHLNNLETAPPLYLVLGRTASGIDNLFQAAGWNFRLRFPDEETARLVVYACYEPYGVFVTLPDATGWTYLCSAINGETKYAPKEGSPDAFDPTKTLSFDADGGGLQQLGLSASEAHELRTILGIRSQSGLSEAQQDRLEVLAAKGNRPTDATTGKGRPFSIRTDILRTGERELRYVCHLIRRDRWPLCPVNGVLVLLPWAAGESESVAQNVATELSTNLQIVRNTFQLHYPTIAAICDLELARGFGQFRAAFGPDQLKQRLGQRIPLVPVRTESTPPTPALISQGVQCIAHAVMPVWILSALKFTTQAGQADSEVGPDEPYPKADEHDPNRELYRLLREFHRRVPGFASILSRIPVLAAGMEEERNDLDALPLFGGCYLTGTGNRPFRQAFVTGVFRRLIDDQAAVAWTRYAYAEDQRFWRLTRIGYAVIVILVVGLLAAARHEMTK